MFLTSTWDGAFVNRLFAVGRLRPTQRETGGRRCEASFNESLYSAVDEKGRPTRAINEAIHPSPITRFGKSTHVCSNDDEGSCALVTYVPKTLEPFFAGGAFSGLPVVGDDPAPGAAAGPPSAPAQGDRLQPGGA